MAPLAPRIPLFLLAGERDNPSKDAVQSVREIMERRVTQQGRVRPVIASRLQITAT